MTRWLVVMTLALLKFYGSSVQEGILHSPEGKIMGGSLVSDIKGQPYMVSVNVNRRNEWWFVCGGSLISQFYVVTSCHCLARFENDTGPAVSLHLPMDKWLFVAGTVRLSEFDETYQARHPESLRHHPKCAVEEMAEYDVGVAKMVEPFELTEHVKVVEIPSYEAGKFERWFTELRVLPPKCTVSGWGTTEKKTFNTEETRQTGIPSPNYKSDQLKTVRMYIMDPGRCWSYFRGLDADDAFEEDDRDLEAYKQICITSRYGNEGFCTGDSGSPLVCNGYLVAVVSSSPECGSEAPQICQKVTVLLEWLGKELCADSKTCGRPEEIALRTVSQAEWHLTSAQIICLCVVGNVIINVL